MEFPTNEMRYESASLYEKTEATLSLVRYKQSPAYLLQLRQAIHDYKIKSLRPSSDLEKRKLRLKYFEAEMELSDLLAGCKPKALSGFIALRLGR